jgi:hypothetical protein
MVHWDAGIMVPLGAFAMTIIIVAVKSFQKMREREVQAHTELRQREMDYERRMKEMEIEKLKLEVERNKVERVS